jgi:uncharacterized protein (DUF4415 family)
MEPDIADRSRRITMSDPKVIYDEENPEWTAADFAAAQHASEVLPPEAIAAFARARGRPKSDAPKVAVKLRLDPDVLQAYKSQGAGWQTRMNGVLRDALGPRGSERRPNPNSGKTRNKA